MELIYASQIFNQNTCFRQLISVHLQKAMKINFNRDFNIPLKPIEISHNS